LHCQSVMAAVFHHNYYGSSHISNVPVHFGNFDSITPSNTPQALINHKIPTYAHQILNFNWAIYSFGGGHFASAILSPNLPFHVKLACDQYELGRTLFQEFTTCPNIFSSGNDLLHHIWVLGDSLQIHGYLIHSLHFKDSDTTSTFWQVQSTIIAQLCSLCNLQLVVEIIIPDHDGCCVKICACTLKVAGWCIS